MPRGATGAVVLVSGERFQVREWSGCYLQVIDTAYAHRPVAEWKNGGAAPMQRRQAARAEARRLNDWDAHTDAPLDFPLA